MLFNKMTGGYLISIAFFLLVAFAALSSAVSLLEVVVSYVVDTRNTKRSTATWTAGSPTPLMATWCTARPP